MPAARRPIALVFAVLIACEDPFTNGHPPASPGAVIPGLGKLGYGCSIGCTAWSADSKTLYIVALVGSATTASLLALDPVTLTPRTVGPIDAAATDLQLTADGTALYFVGQNRSPPGGALIERMSLPDGSTTTLANLNEIEFSISPDGRALAYHAFATPPTDSAFAHDSLPADTVVVLDLPSGVRRRMMVTLSARLGGFSADGTQLIVMPDASLIYIWHLDTGTRDSISIARGSRDVPQVAWSGGAFRMLLSSIGAATTFSDTSLAGGSARVFIDGTDVNTFQWLPDRSAMWMLSSSQICGPLDCDAMHYDFVYTTTTASGLVGSANCAPQFRLHLDASPDGQWVAHSETVDAIYLLHRTTP
jgi:hypothetical protein